MAPGGNVAVWLRGDELVTEVFFGKAAETPVDWKLVYNGDLSRKRYIERTLKSDLTEEQFNQLRRDEIPLDRWSTWSTKTQLQPVLGGRKLSRLTIEYWNAEREVVALAYGDVIEKKERALPQNVNLGFLGSDGTTRRATLVSFDEHEIFSEVAKIKALKGNDCLIDLRFEINETGQSVKTFLQAGDYIFEFKKTTIEAIR